MAPHSFTAPANSMDLHKPVITVSNSSVYEGNSFTLTCSINANPPTPTQVTWLKDNIIITQNSSRYEIYEDFKILRVPVASVNESGNYQCRVEGKTSFNLNISVIKFCVPSTMVLIFTTFAAIIFGSLPTCLMCYYIRKRKEREFHLQYQNAHYQALSNRPTPAVYNELNKVNDNAYSTTKNDANATSAAVDETRTKVDLIYEDVKKRKEREFHLQYQNAHYQALSNRPTPAVYNELNKVNDNTYSTTKNDANATSAAVDETRTKVDPIYEDVKA
ncbi:carcinoembryonic antigen-related cell adhesion molecule 1-like [Anneissia japonica]|uniref:carcinoembryonic antigen-related cell adhesion molecule 1-like n=1 Tax=Anneissia japonica TaxID=1529436 RepID=UPI0014256671|nr:carcinoembryonic antigen-related cell adhesion molecule 1-like [Anneissia japonica]